MSNPYDPNAGAQPAPDPYNQGSAPDAPQYGDQPSGQSPYAQHSYGQPAAPDPYAQPTQPQVYGQTYADPYVPAQEYPQGTTILVFGIIGIFVAVFAPIAWVMGNKALKEMRASGLQYSNEQSVTVGRVLGIAFSILYALSIVLMIVAFVVIFVAASVSQ